MHLLSYIWEEHFRSKYAIGTKRNVEFAFEQKFLKSRFVWLVHILISDMTNIIICLFSIRFGMKRKQLEWNLTVSSTPIAHY